jgi:hypothetical protein
MRTLRLSKNAKLPPSHSTRQEPPALPQRREGAYQESQLLSSDSDAVRIGQGSCSILQVHPHDSRREADVTSVSVSVLFSMAVLQSAFVNLLPTNIDASGGKAVNQLRSLAINVDLTVISPLTMAIASTLILVLSYIERSQWRLNKIIPSPFNAFDLT